MNPSRSDRFSLSVGVGEVLHIGFQILLVFDSLFELLPSLIEHFLSLLHELLGMLSYECGLEVLSLLKTRLERTVLLLAHNESLLGTLMR